MKITVINGVKNAGCTYKIKDMFLESLGGGHEVTEYRLPADMPEFCTGCKACFVHGMGVCPHSSYTLPIWESIRAADLLVFTSPVYVFHATGQMKALLDHLGTKWMSHSPEKEMFKKRAVIITDEAGAGLKNVIKDIGVSLDFWGVARRYSVAAPLFYTFWDKVSDKTKENIKKQCERAAKKVRKPVSRPRFKVRFYFSVMRSAQKMIHKKLQKDNEPETADHAHWQKNGWLDGGRPWK